MYWEKLDQIEDTYRKPIRSSGPARKEKPYDDRVYEYYVNMREEDKSSVSDLLFYCRSVDEFVKDYSNPHSQKMWVRRFIRHFFCSTSEVDETPASAGQQGGGDDVGEGPSDGTKAKSVRKTPSGGVRNCDRLGGSATGENDARLDENAAGENADENGDRLDENAAGENADENGGRLDESADDNNGGGAGGNVDDIAGCIGENAGDDAADLESVSGDIDCGESARGSASDYDPSHQDEGVSDSDGSLFELDEVAEKSVTTYDRGFFRKRTYKNEDAVDWSDGKSYVAVFRDDLNNLLPGQLMTETALDYFIHRHLARLPGVSVHGTHLFRSIELAWETKDADKREERFASLRELISWKPHRYVLLLVWCSDFSEIA
ncbi:hypothetical protein JG687_00019103 [Phytophthora cactorum]|uniref:Uncharacterized protein n=1 Tax=Phytophthora cactorum TaxID=29920 RepID=A0A8T1TMP3_9STRA|nr:hypothetical protein PC123_g10025 [Phytophthora cactorum]KAG6942380.1 hypothetical protein JG687_00019103 [Phytophthora cactorum]